MAVDSKLPIRSNQRAQKQRDDLIPLFSLSRERAWDDLG